MFGDFSPSFRTNNLRSLLPAALTERLRGRVFPVIRAIVLRLLAGRDAHDFDGVADHVGGALLAFGASRHRRPSLPTQTLCPRFAPVELFRVWTSRPQPLQSQ